MMLYSPRGTPATFRNMHGFGAHTFRMENKNGESFFVKFHYITESGIKNNTPDEVKKISSETSDYCKEDLIKHLKEGNTASWRACLQIMPEADAEKYEWDILDVTKIWPHKDYPLIEYGKLVLTRPADNEFQETEQVAFCPANLVPGIHPSNDLMLIGRMFAYDDTHRYRLGPLFHQIPINKPINNVSHYGSNGPMEITDDNMKKAYYFPNSLGGPRLDPENLDYPYQVKGEAKRQGIRHPCDDFVQPRKLLLEVMSKKERLQTRDNFVEDLNKVESKEIVLRFVKVLSLVDLNFAIDVGRHLHNKITKKEIEDYEHPNKYIRKYRVVDRAQSGLSRHEDYRKYLVKDGNYSCPKQHWTEKDKFESKEREHRENIPEYQLKTQH